MTVNLPILGGDADTTTRLKRRLMETWEDVPNAFPPRRTPVPQPAEAAPDATLKQIMGFFTDTTLCIGCKACEVACKQWNQLPSDGLKFTGYSYDNTGHLGASTWRHVKFKEKMAEDGDGTQSRWLMMSDVCKHCESAPCHHSCPTGAIIYNQFGDVYVQNDICNGCGYCITACPFGVLGRADRVDEPRGSSEGYGPHDPRGGDGARGRSWADVRGGGGGRGNRVQDVPIYEPLTDLHDLSGDGRAHKCTLCMDRQAEDMTPACAKSCPTASIQFGPLEDLRAKARSRVDELSRRGNDRAYLYGCDSVGDYGPLNAFFLLEDHPNEYNLPENPPQPFQGQGDRYARSFLAGAALTALSFLLFRGANSNGGRTRGW
jgi:formate dehydrogenase iron-sulfur subunit